MARVLVTGANGFVGQPVCRLLTERGYEVRAAVRSADKLRGGVVVGDITAATQWPLTGIEAVIHLAARVHVMHDDSADPLTEFRALNVAATENLARQAAAAGVKRLVYVSSIKVNGESTPKDRGFTEQSPPAPIDPYGISKWEAEQALHAISRETKLEVVIVRPPLIYGAGVKGNLLTLLRAVDHNIPLPVASADNRRSLIGVHNLADLLEKCISHPAAAGQTFLASDGDDISTPELLRRIGAALGKPARLIPVPESLLRSTLRLSRGAAMIDRLFGSLVVDASHARQTLGWKPSVSMQAELVQTVQGYRRADAQ